MDIKYIYEKDVSYCSCNFVIPIGTNNLNDKSPNTAHLIEHLIFHGHSKWEQSYLLNYFESSGGIINASTELEYTTIYFRIHKSKIITALKLLLPAITEFNISEEVYKIEKRVIKIEEKNFNSYFENVAIKKAITSFYSFENFNKNASYKKMLKIYKENYDISNWTLFLIGDIDNKLKRKINDACEKYLTIENQTSKTEIKSNIVIDPKYTFHADLKYKSTCKYFTYIKQYNNSNILSMKLYRNLIANGLSSPLYRELTCDNGFCYNIYAVNNIFSFDNSFLVFAKYEGDSNAIEEIVLRNCSLIETIEKMKDSEFIKAKEKTLCEFYLKCENIGQYSHMIIENYIANKSIITYKELINRLSKMNAKDIKQLMINLYTRY